MERQLAIPNLTQIGQDAGLWTVQTVIQAFRQTVAVPEPPFSEHALLNLFVKNAFPEYRALRHGRTDGLTNMVSAQGVSFIAS